MVLLKLRKLKIKKNFQLQSVRSRSKLECEIGFRLFGSRSCEHVMTKVYFATRSYTFVIIPHKQCADIDVLVINFR